MTASTPEQAAYESLRASWLANRIGSPSLEWEKLGDEERAEWGAILADVTAERERLGDANDQLRQLVDRRGQVMTEMIAHWDRAGTTREEDVLIPEWRERAGLEAS